MRYITRAAKPVFIETPLWDDSRPMSLNVTVDGEKETDTGLVDEMGNGIYRLQAPIGFGRDSER